MDPIEKMVLVNFVKRCVQAPGLHINQVLFVLTTERAQEYEQFFAQTIKKLCEADPNKLIIEENFFFRLYPSGNFVILHDTVDNISILNDCLRYMADGKSSQWLRRKYSGILTESSFLIRALLIISMLT